MLRHPPTLPLFPYTTLFRSPPIPAGQRDHRERHGNLPLGDHQAPELADREPITDGDRVGTRERLRSEEHTSELQSHSDLVCRLLLEKKKNNPHNKLDKFTLN